MAANALWYGDNLDVLRERIASESVDLIYLDPPFNSNRSYNVQYGRSHGDEAQAQIEAFDDTWTWTPETEQLYIALLSGEAPPHVADALQAMHGLVGEGEVMAYLVMMTPRLVELHRVLRPTGSIYLHCDPTASHYLKILMDAIFGPTHFVNEVVWQRAAAAKGHSTRKFSSSHDVLLVYGKTEAYLFRSAHLEPTAEYAARFKYDDDDGRGPYRIAPLDNPAYRPNLIYEYKGFPSPPRGWRIGREVMEQLDADGRLAFPKKPGGRIGRKHYLEEQSGPKAGDVWTDIPPIQASAAERLGYPTQKPQALLERIIAASSNEGGLVLDPFCGCGTAAAAAQALGRRWIGIDITFIAIDLVRRRLEDAYGEKLDYELHGIPRDMGGARALFEESPFDFERWAVSMVQGQPNEKQVGDKGIDGVVRFPLDAKASVGRCLVSVKGGGQVGPAMVRELGGAVRTQKAEMGVLITMDKMTPGMIDEANHAGSYTWPVNGGTFPRIQLVTVAQLLRNEQPKLPPVLTPYLKATRHTVKADQLTIDA